MAIEQVRMRLESRPAEEAAPLESVFQRHWPRIYAVLRRLVGDAAEAEDLALETFYRYACRPPRGRPEGVEGWLYRVATRLGLNSLRARHRRARYEEQAGWNLSGTAATSGDPAETVVQEAARQEKVNAVRRALAEIKPQYAELLSLRHAGLSYQQLAQTLGLAPSSIGPLLVRAEREFEARYSREAQNETPQ